METTRLNHPKVTINNAKQRLLETVRNSTVYEIIKYQVWMCDDIYDAEKYAREELEEKNIKLPDDFNFEIYIDVAKYDVAKEQLLKTLDRNSLTEEEQAEVNMLNALYPISVAIKSVLVDDFTL